MLLEARNVSKDFYRETKNSNRFTAVNDISINVSAGELCVLMGRSGGGKTTLLNILSGLLKPTRGSVLLDGKDLYELSDRELSLIRNRSFGVIPQGQTAIQSLKVIENILLPLKLYGKADDKDISFARELLERLDIAHLESAAPAELSGGELRRMAIARALIGKPGFIFADEPTGDLDDENTALVFSFLKERAKAGSGVFIVSHESDAKEYADRVLIMQSGKIERA